MTQLTTIDVDALAQEIRRVDGNHSLGAGALAEALIPFLSTLPIAGEGKVKALEWNPFTAYTPFGYHYSVWERDNGVWECNLLDGQFKTLEAIRAAAQTDFETRILSALVWGGK